MIRTLVIGYGSIGKRHTRLLQAMGCHVAVLSSHATEWPAYSSLQHAIELETPEYIVVANKTVEHHNVIHELISHGYQGRILVEKPLFHDAFQLPAHHFAMAGVAYNLRFHPLLQRLKKLLSSQKIVSAHVYCGSYLPNWRPGSDYRQSYSASVDEGGGVLRDLSHELDYCNWLFGPWKSMTSAGGHISGLEIESDDAFSLLMDTDACHLLTIHINYLDRAAARKIIVNTENQTIQVDLIQNVLDINGAQELVPIERDETYRAEHECMLSGNITDICTFDQASEVLFTIKSAELAARSRTWIRR